MPMNKTKILVTGNMGYVGPVLAHYLRCLEEPVELIGLDTGYFGHCLTGAKFFPEILYSCQHLEDIRDINEEVLSGVDAIVHLAAISNDPMGNEFADATGTINRDATIRFALLASKAKVKSFVFASSCSIYGAGGTEPKVETDTLNPLTPYAHSKVDVEEQLRIADLGSMTFTSLRFATACGMSDRLRLDLVLNDFVACAVAKREISILSDGTPWRPLIDVRDMARAIWWAIRRPASLGGAWLAVNVGSNDANYQVRDLAEAVAELIPRVGISINKDADSDKRS